MLIQFVREFLLEQLEIFDENLHRNRIQRLQIRDAQTRSRPDRDRPTRTDRVGPRTRSTTSVRLGRSQRCWVCRFGPSSSLESIDSVQVLFESIEPIGLDRVDQSSLCSKRGDIISVFKMDNHTTSIIHIV